MKKTMVAHAGRTGGKFVDIDFGRVGSRAAVASYRSGSHSAGVGFGPADRLGEQGPFRVIVADDRQRAVRRLKFDQAFSRP